MVMKRVYEGLATDLLFALHAFNCLTLSKVEQIGQLFELDAKELCSEQGIVYTIDEPETISLTKDELETFRLDSIKEIGWSDSSYKIIKFLGEDPTEGT